MSRLNNTPQHAPPLSAVGGPPRHFSSCADNRPAGVRDTDRGAGKRLGRPGNNCAAGVATTTCHAKTPYG